MPSTVRNLLHTASLQLGGVVAWGHPVPVEKPGVYLVALNDDQDTMRGTLRSAFINDAAVAELLRERSDLTIDNKVGTHATLAERVAEFWLPDENILYIGLAGTSLARRVSAYYSTKLGHRSPHAGGWFLKLLANLPDLYVHYAIAGDPDVAEDRLLSAFVDGVSPGTRGGCGTPTTRSPTPTLNGPRVSASVTASGVPPAVRAQAPRSRVPDRSERSGPVSQNRTFRALHAPGPTWRRSTSSSKGSSDEDSGARSPQ